MSITLAPDDPQVKAILSKMWEEQGPVRMQNKTRSTKHPDSWWVYTLEFDTPDVKVVGTPQLVPVDEQARKRKRKRGCQDHIVKWMGIRWYGTPKPLRIWKRLRGSKKKFKHCGCMVKPKAAWQGFKLWMRFIRYA